MLQLGQAAWAAAPTVSDSAGARTTAEDTALSITGVTVADTDGGNLTVTVTATQGTITLATTSNLSSLTGNGTASVSFSATIANANTALGGMTFTPTANFNGSATFNVTANDGTTTAALGAKTVTVTAVNDSPVGVADSASLTEDDTTVTGNVLTNDTDPDTADTGSTETKTVSALSGGSLGVAKFGSYGYLMLGAAGAYTYTLDGNLNAVQSLASGSSLTETFTYTVADRVGLTATANLTVTITGANDRPSLVASPVIRTQPENTTSAFPVSALLSDIQGAMIGLDRDSGTQLGLAITGITTADSTTSMAGTWSYSLNNGNTWTTFPNITVTSALLLRPTDQIKFTVNDSTSIDSRNSGQVTMTYRAWDQSTGTAGSTVDPSVGSGTAPYSVDSNTAAMNVIPVNDAPVLSTAALQVNEHNGSYPAGGVSVNLSTGFTQDSTQTGTLTGTLSLYDPDNSASQIVYRIEELPAKGRLTLAGATLAVGSVFTHAEASDVRYTYGPENPAEFVELAANTTDQFYLSVRDGAGGEIGSSGKTGANPWASVDVTILDVNSPVRITGTSLKVSENNNPDDLSHPEVVANIPLVISDADDPSDLRLLKVTSLPSSDLGHLEYWDGSAYATLIQGQLPFTIPVTTLQVHPLRFSYNNTVEPTDVNAALVAQYSQSSFTVTASDNRVAGASSASATVSLSITPVNDPPVLVIHSPLSVAKGSVDNIIGNASQNNRIAATDPDSPANLRVYSVTRDPEYGYLTLSGVRLGGGFTFTEADLTAGNLKYSRNDAVSTTADSVKFVVADGHGGTSTEGTLIINIPTGGSGFAFRAIVPEDLFVALTNAVSFNSNASVTSTRPSHGKLYKAGAGELTYAPSASATSFTQGDIDAGKIVYVHNGTEPSGYGYADSVTLSISDANSITTASLIFTITPVDDPPYLAQGEVAIPNGDDAALVEQQADGTDGRVGADFNLTGIGSAVKLRGGSGDLWVTGAADHFHYYDSDSSSILYYANTVKGQLARWSGTAWEYLSVDDSTGLSMFSAADLNAGNIAYFHVPTNDVATASATIISASVTVYATDGGRVSAGDVVISSGTVSESATRTVNDGTDKIALPRLALNRSPSRTLTLAIQDVNDAPVGTAKTFTVTEYSSGIPGQTSHIQVLGTGQIAVSDPDSDPAAFNYTVTVLPTNGKLQKSDGAATPAWSDLAVNATFTQAELTGGRVRYVNTGNVEVFFETDWSTPKDSFQYTVSDGDGATSSATTVSVKLRPTNEPPKVANNGPGSVPEGGALKITGTLLGAANAANSADIVAAVDTDSSRTQVQYRITTVPAAGYLYEGNATTGAVIRQLGVGSVFTLKDLQDGKVWYRHNASEPSSHGGSVTFGYAISDASGMAEPTASFTINVTPINDAPLVTGLSGGLNYTEADTSAGTPMQIDSSVSVADNDLANNGLDFRGGSLRITYASGGNAGDQLGVLNQGTGVGQIGVSGSSIRYANVEIGTVDSTDNGLNGNPLKINFSAGANSSLTTAAVEALIQAITFAHSPSDIAITGQRTLTYTLVDGGGTTAVSDSIPVSFQGADTWTGTATITVVAANDRPLLTAHTGGGNLGLGTVGDEDSATPTSHQVSGFLADTADATHTGIVDPDGTAVSAIGIAVTGSTVAATGKWQYSADGTTWTDLGSVSTGNALLLGPSYRIRFLPDGLEGGTATLTYLAWDQTSGTTGTRVNTALNSGQTSAFSTASDTLAVTVTAVNDAPTLTGISGNSVTTAEDATFSFSGGNRLTLADVDAGSGIASLSFTLTGSGTYQFTSTSGIYTDSNGSSANTTWTGFNAASGSAGTVTLYGTVANLNTLLGTLQYVPAANANDNNLASQSPTGTPTLAITADDRGFGLTGTAGTAQTASRSITVSITAVNDTPSLTLSASDFSVTENASATAVSNTVTSADANDQYDTGYAPSGSIPYLVVTGLRGTLSLNGSAVNLTGQLSNGNRTLTLTSTRTGYANAYGDLNAALVSANYLMYQPDANFSGLDTLTFVLHDNSQAGSGGDKTATTTITVSVGGANNAPTMSGLDATSANTYVEDGSAVVIDANVTVSDVELSAYNNWGGAVLTVARSGGASAEDVFGWTGSGNTGVNASGSNVRINSTVVGSFTATAGTLTVTFANNVTTAQVATVLQAINYANSNNNPPGSVTLAYTLNDGNTNTGNNPQGTGGALSTTGSITVNITANNDAPTLTGITTPLSYTEDAAAVTLGSAAVPGDPELNYLNSGNGNWSGATLTLSRNGGASATDVFGWTGSGGTGVNATGVDASAGNVRIDTTDVGTFTSANGTLSITFGSGVTQAQVQQVLRGITYQFTGQFLGSAATASVTLNWVLNDGNVTAQGQGGARSVTVAQVINLTGQNDAPVLADTVLTATSVAEDAAAASGAVGFLVSSLATSGPGNITDADTNNLWGFAIVATDSTQGTWSYSINGGTTWTTFIAADSTARLLAADANTRLHFRPTAQWNGTLSSALTVRAWDRISGSNGGTADLSTVGSRGGTTSFSAAIDTVSLTVTPVNDAPTRTSATATLASINEDQATSATDPAVINDGATVSSLFSGVFSDAIDASGGSSANALAGVVVVSNSANASTQGTWQFKTGAGGTWTAIGSRTTSNGRYLDDADFIRFVPVANFNGTPTGLTVRLADNSTDAVASGTESIDVSDDSTKSGGTTRYSSSANAVTLNTSVTAINDAPIRTAATVTLAAINEDQATTASDPTVLNNGVALSSLLSSVFSDSADLVTSAASGGSSANAFAGVVFVENTANAVNEGVWQYYRPGSGYWKPVGVISGSDGRYLDTDVLIRFVPVANFTGSPSGLLLRLVDDSTGGLLSGQVNIDLSDDITKSGGTTRFSSSGNAVALNTSINAINDAPSLSAASTNPSVTENSSTGSGQSIDPVNLFSGASVSDIDLTTTTGLSSTVFGKGTITAQLTDGIAGDVLLVSIPLPSGVTTNGGSGSSAFTITLAATSTLTDVQNLINAIQYRSTSDNPSVNGTDTERSYTLVISDGRNEQGAGPSYAGATAQSSATLSGTLTITQANDAPVVDLNGATAGTGNSVIWTEGQNVTSTAVALAPSATLTDVDNANLATLTLVVSGVLDVTLERITIGGTLFSLATSASSTAVGSFLVSYDPGTRTFTVVPNATAPAVATMASFQSLLQGITYNHKSEKPTDGNRTVTVSVTDAGLNDDTTWVSQLVSATAVITIDVNPVNDRPVVVAGGMMSYAENGVAAAIDTGLTVSDRDDTQIAGATVTISAGLTSGDELGFTTQNGISGTYSSGTGVLTLTGTATLANYQTALRSVTYRSTSEDPTSTSTTRTVTWSVTDANSDGLGAASSASVTSTINLTAANDVPVMVAGGTKSYTENAAASAIDTAVTVSDVDDTQIAGATVSITAGLTSGDVLGFTTQNGISGTYVSETGVLTLTGTATLGNYQTALRSVTYQSTSDDPTSTSASRTVTWSVTDANSDGAGAGTSVAVTSTINLTAVNDLPVVGSATGTLNYTENGSAAAIRGTLTVSDVDDTQIAGATVTISAGLTGGDELGFTTQNGISGTYVSETGLLTLTGTATLANYQTALRSVTYRSTSDDPTSASASRTVTWRVTDANSDGAGAATSAAVTSTINLTVVNDAPVVVAGGTMSYTENGAATAIDTGLTVSDVDDTQIAGAKVTISAGLTSGDELGFTTQNGISGAYVSGTGVLTMTGTTTLANYQAALRSVTYRSTSDDPTSMSPSRTVSWVVTDANSDGAGSATSVAVTSTINLTVVNDAPVVVAGGTMSYTENGVAAAIDTGVTVSDADDTQIAGATVTLSAGLTTGDELGFVAQNGISGTYVPGTGVLTLTGTATLANYQTALRSVTYRSSSDAPTATSGSRTVSWSVTDANSDGAGAATSLAVTSTINLIAVNDAPVLADTALSTPAIEEDSGVPSGAVGFLVSTLATSGNVTDPDVNDTLGIAIVATVPSHGTWYYSTDNGTSWTAFTATANATRLLSADSNNRLYLRPTANLNGTLTDSLTIRAWDGSTGSNGGAADLSAAGSTGGSAAFSSATDTVSLLVTPVNDAPIASGTVSLSSFREDYSPVASTVGFRFSSRLNDSADAVAGGSSANSLVGIVVVGNAANAVTEGVWEYRPSGSLTSSPLPAVSESAGWLLSTLDVLRFVPVANFNGTPGGLTVRLVEGPGTVTAGGPVPDFTVSSNSGGATVYSASTIPCGVTVLYVNDPPVLTATLANPTVNENASTGSGTSIDPVNLLSGAVVSDIDLTTTPGLTATVFGAGTITARLTDGISGDVLQLSGTLPTGVTVAGGTADTALTITLDGDTTLTEVAALLNALQYKSTSDDPTVNGTDSGRTYTVVVFDGRNTQGSPPVHAGDYANAFTTLTGADSATLSGSIAVIAANDAPVVVAGGTMSYTENGAAAAIDAGVTVSDADDTHIAGATVTISAGLTTGDELGLVAQNGISGTYVSGTGVLTLTGTTTLANYQTALRSVTYRSTSKDPTATSTSRTVSWRVTDANSDGAGAATSVAVTSTINLTVANDAPVVVAGGTMSYTENGAAAAIDTGVTVSDADDSQMAGATVTISAGRTTGDELGFTTQNGISGTYVAETGVLTLTGTATLANYQTALRSVTYRSTSEDPTVTSTSRTVSWRVTDANSDGAGAATSVAVTSTVTVTAVNDQPVITDVTTATFNENAVNAAPAIIDSDVTVTDPDSRDLNGGTLTVGNLYPDDKVSLPASAADALGNIRKTGSNVEYHNGSSWVVVGTHAGGVSAPFVVTWNANSTPAIAERVIENLTFANGSDAPFTVRGLNVSLDDGDGGAVQTVTINVVITEENDPPLLDLNGPAAGTGNSVTWVEGQNVPHVEVRLAPATMLSDPDDTRGSEVRITVFGSVDPGEELVVGVTHFNLSTDYTAVVRGAYRYDYDSSTKTLRIRGGISYQGSYSISMDPEIIRAVQYNNLSDNPTAGERRFDIRVMDGSIVNDVPVDAAWSNLTSATVTVIPVNDQPTLADLNAAVFTENSVNANAARLDSDVTVTDQDSANFDGGTLTVSGLDAADTVSLPATAVEGLGSIRKNGLNVEHHNGTSWTVVGTHNGGVGASLLVDWNANATPIIAERVIESLTFANSSDAPVTVRTLTLSLNDGDGGTTQDGTITVTLVRDNDAPSLASTSLGATYTEQGTAVAFVSGTITVSDPDGPANFFAGGVGSLTVSLDGYQSGDSLSVAHQGTSSGEIGVSGAAISFGGSDFATFAGGAASDLVITFTSTSATPSAIQALLARLRFFNADNEDPTADNTDLSRVFTVTLNDGGNTKDAGSSTVALTASITGTIAVGALNDAPRVLAGGTLNYTENGAATAIDPGVTVSDPDDSQIAGATVTISAGLTTGDELGFTPQNGISGAYIPGTGVLTLTGTATLANYQTALRSVNYRSTSDDPTSTSASRTVSWVVTDANSDGAGAATSMAVTGTITITAVNDVPVMTAGGTLNYTENGTAAVIRTPITITDADDTQITGATVTISAGLTTGDVLGFTTQTGITGGYDVSTGTLTLSGTKTLPEYQALLESVTYRSTSDNPTSTSPSRTVTWAVTDANSDNVGAATGTATSTISITVVNDQPVISGLDAATFLENAVNASAAVLDSDVTVTEQDSSDYNGGTLTVSGLAANDTVSLPGTPASPVAGDIRRDVNNVDHYTGSTWQTIGTCAGGVAADFVITWNLDTDSIKVIPAIAERVVDSLTFANSSQNPVATRTLTLALNDGDGGAAQNAAVTVTITAENDPPSLATPTAITFTDTAINNTFDPVTGTLSGTDPDTGTILTYGIIGGTDGSGGTTVSLVGTYGTLTVTKSSGVYSFVPNSGAINSQDFGENPSETFPLVVSDGSGGSASSILSVSVTGADDTPTLASVTSGTIAEVDQSATTTDAGLAGTLVGTDVDVETLAYGIDGGTVSGTTVSKAGTYGTLTVTAATGAYVFTKNVSAIEALDATESGSDTFTVTVSDGDAPLASQTYTVTVTGADDPPTLAAVTEGAIAEVDQSMATNDSGLGGTLLGSDVDVESLSYGILGGVVSSDSLTVTRTGTYGTLTVTRSSGVYAFAKDSAAIEALDAGAIVTQTFTVTVSDGDGDLVQKDYVIRITGADDASTLASVPGGSIVEIDQSATTTDLNLTGMLTGADVDSDTLGYGISGGITSGGFVIKSGTYGQLKVNGASGSYEFIKNTAAIEALDAGESASETFVVTVDDGDGDPVSQTYTISVTGADDAPILGTVTSGTIAEVDQSSSTTDAGLAGTLVGADVDVETLTYGIDGGTVSGTTVSKAGTYGTLTVNTSSGAYAFTKNPSAIEALDAGESGTDTFTMTVSDGDGPFVTRTYTVTVSGADDPATLGTVTPGTIAEVDQSATTTDAGLDGTLVGADVDIETLTYGIDGGTTGTGASAGTVSKAGTYGTLTVNTSSGAYAFTKNPSAIEALDVGESGTDTFTLMVSDGDGPWVTRTYSVTVTGANDGPTLESPAELILLDTPVADALEPMFGQLVGLDVDAGSRQRYGLFGVLPNQGVATLQRPYGTLVITNATGGWLFTPNSAAIDALQTNVTETILLTVDDGVVTNQVPWLVRVMGVNDRPVALAQVRTLDEDSTLAITLTATDPDSPSLEFSIVTSPRRGALSGNGAGFAYIPVANANGYDRFTFKVSDGSLESTETEVTLHILPVNDVPILGDVTVPGIEDTVVALPEAVFRERYSDVEGTPLQAIQVLSLPDAGLLLLAGQPVVVGQRIEVAALTAFTYQPDPNDDTRRSFLVSASDGEAGSRPATVLITLAPVNDIPTLVAVSPTSSSRPSLGGTAQPFTRVDVYAQGKWIGSAQTNPQGIWSLVPASPLADGTYSLTATSTDAFNQTSPPCSPVPLVVDTALPRVPTIVVASPTLDQSPPISGNAEPGSRVQVEIDGRFLGIAPVDGAGQWLLKPAAAIPEDAYSLRAVSVDAAGNRSPFSEAAKLVIDLTAPAAPVIRSPAVASRPRPEIEGTAEPGATVVVIVRETGIGTAVVDGRGVWRLTPDRDLEWGPQVLTARARDAAGNLGPVSQSWNLIILDQPPEAPVIEGPSVTFDPTPDIHGTAPPQVLIVVREGEVNLGSTLSDSQGRWSLAPQASMKDGGHILVAESVDGFGRSSPPSAPWQMLIQRVGVAVPTVNFQSTSTGTPVIRGTLDGRETVVLTVTVAGRVYRSSEGSVSIDRSLGRWSLAIPASHRLVAGTYPVEAVAQDAFGDTATDVTTDELLVGIPGDGAKPSGPPVPVSPDALTFLVADRNPLTIDLGSLFSDPARRPLQFALVGSDNVKVALDGSSLRLEFSATFNSQATVRIQVVADPGDPSANPVYAVTVIYDADRDAIPDEVEAVAVDFNRDGIEDAYQNAVATFPMRRFGDGASAPLGDFTSLLVGDYTPSSPGADGLGIVVDARAHINQLTVCQAGELGDPPQGLVEISPVLKFTVNTPTPRPDGTIVVTLVLYQPNTADVVYKFGRRSPTDDDPGFFEFNWDGRTGGQFIDTDGDGRHDLLRLVYRDGERGDDDWTTNGVLVDPVFIAKRDGVPPKPPIWTTPPGRVSVPRPPLAGMAEPLSMVRVYSGTSQIGSVLADESGRWALRPEQDLPDGRLTLEATATDPARNTSLRSPGLELWVQTQVILSDDTMSRVPGKPLKIPVALVLSNDFARSGPLRILQVDAKSTRGGTLRLERGWIVYTPAQGLPDNQVDSFTYTAGDGRDSAQAQVHLIGEPWRVDAAKSLVRVIPLSVGVSLRFSVIPSQRYLISASNRIGSGEDWKPLAAVWSDDQGRLEVRDPDGLGATRFYRIEELP